MPVSVAASGSQTATLTTEHTLVTQAGPTGGAVYQLRVDSANLANGETLTLALRTRARSGDTTRTIYTAVFTNVQGDPIKDSPAIAVPVSNETMVTLKQDGGTGRAFPWALMRLDG